MCRTFSAIFLLKVRHNFHVLTHFYSKYHSSNKRCSTDFHPLLGIFPSGSGTSHCGSDLIEPSRHLPGMVLNWPHKTIAGQVMRHWKGQNRCHITVLLLSMPFINCSGSYSIGLAVSKTDDKYDKHSITNPFGQTLRTGEPVSPLRATFSVARYNCGCHSPLPQSNRGCMDYLS